MVSTKDVATINFEKTKKVACLYRVSTKGQVDHDDIPMQKTACREFIAQHENWSIYKEYYEKGVSGYKVSAKKRDELQRVLADAQQGLFQVLLVFMFDRIGRKEDESPFLVETFVHMGIEVWSVIEGQRKIETHVDKLLNYIGFWQASGESQKTSMRVEEKHKQMVKQGEYRGGIAPYGYKLVKSGEINKKGKELYKLAIDETESEIIKKIYNLSYEEGYGSSRIANWLNEKNILTRSSKLWNISAINYIFRNPIYKGYMSYGKSTRKSGSPIVQDKSDWILSENKIEELAIIDEYTWNKVQQLRDGRTRSKREDTSAILQTKSPLLLTGMIHCGYCGSSLSTTYHSKEWTNKDGSKHRIVKPKYRCVGKAMKKTLCEGQTNYAQRIIEDKVKFIIYSYLDELETIDFTNKANQYKHKDLDKDTLEFKRLQKQNEENYDDLMILNREVPKSLRGESFYKPEMLSKLIEDKEKEIDETNKKINLLLEKINEAKNQTQDMEEFQKCIPIWKDVFENATPEKKKMMLSRIVKDIVVYKDEVEITLKYYVQDFLDMVSRVNGGIKPSKLGVQPAQKHTPKYIEITLYSSRDNKITTMGM